MVTWISAGLYILKVEDDRYYECYYNVCSGYDDAEVVDRVCGCYGYDVLGDLRLEKTEVLE